MTTGNSPGHRPDSPAATWAPRLVGIVNITEDSFSDGGRYLAPGDALAHARVAYLNDIHGFADPGQHGPLAESGCRLVVMHSATR